MILVIGTKNCSKCAMTKTILENKGLDYTYKLISDYSDVEQNNFLILAKEIGQASFPLIFKDDKIISIKEI